MMGIGDWAQSPRNVFIKNTLLKYFFIIYIIIYIIKENREISGYNELNF